MVFKRKPKTTIQHQTDNEGLPPPPTYPQPPTPTIEVPVTTNKPQPQPQPPQLPDDLKEAIDHFNNTYTGTFPQSELSQTKDLLFAIYAEIRAIRKEGQ